MGFLFSNEVGLFLCRGRGVVRILGTICDCVAFQVGTKKDLGRTRMRKWWRWGKMREGSLFFLKVHRQATSVEINIWSGFAGHSLSSFVCLKMLHFPPCFIPRERKLQRHYTIRAVSQHKAIKVCNRNVLLLPLWWRGAGRGFGANSNLDLQWKKIAID